MKELKRREHPGWAIKFKDGTWLGGPHGWHHHDDAFYADIYSSPEEAKDCYEMSELTSPYDIVLAWEPLCERLRFEVVSLTKTNKVSPGDLSDLESDIEMILSKIKEMQQ